MKRKTVILQLSVFSKFREDTGSFELFHHFAKDTFLQVSIFLNIF